MNEKLDFFADDYKDFADRAYKLEQKIYPILEYNRIEYFKDLYDQVIDLNHKLIRSPMFTEYSKFLANINFVNNRYEVFKEKVDIDAKIAERVYEIKEAIISEYEEQKNREVKQAKEDIAKKLQDKYDNQSSIIKNLNVENQ